MPLGGGTLRLPEIKVPWWNLETGTRQVATLPIRTLSIQGAAGPFGLPASLTDPGSGWSKVWTPDRRPAAGARRLLGRGPLSPPGPRTSVPGPAARLTGWTRRVVGALGRRTALTLAG